MTNGRILRKNLVLVGGGHAHVEVIRRWAMEPVSDVNVTLVSAHGYAPYSGMLPGLIGGTYSLDDAYIDLRALCFHAGVSFVGAPVVGIDPFHCEVRFSDRPNISYDVLSINVGSVPSTDGVKGVKRHAIPVKPVSAFLDRMDEWMEHWERGEARGAVTVVGGGAGSVELVLSLRQRLRRHLADNQLPAFRLVTRSREIMGTHARGVRSRLAKALEKAGIEVITGFSVQEVKKNSLISEDGESLDSDKVIWVTHASALGWIKDSGLTTDDKGFLLVNDDLEVQNFAGVFAAGDCATLRNQPRPKSGVFAVRQGPILYENLKNRLLDQPLLEHRLQSRFLSLIGTGNDRAVVSRGGLAAEGAWAWRWKRWIDENWMARYRPPFPGMNGRRREVLTKPDDPDLRCKGCGGKSPGDVLERVLSRIERVESDSLIHRQDPEDGVVLLPPGGMLQVQSIDYISQLVSDPHVFGAIAAEHALNDIYAMGAKPSLALAQAIVPHGEVGVVEEYLVQMLSGAARVLKDSHVTLAGGHSSEGAEPGLGFSLTGWVRKTGIWKKGGITEGDCLILTKPIGVGVVLAGEMRGLAKGAWVESAIVNMMKGHSGIAETLEGIQVKACTDVTGYGLAGHAVEMAEASGVQVELGGEMLALVDGSLELEQKGVRSSLFAANFRSFSHQIGRAHV